MTQLIATNQLTLTNVIDGKTPYVHWAYSGNADGTGLTLTDNGQRYIGNYSDYTQADSTDKTKYRWADRWAKIEVGGVNLIKNSRIVNIASNNNSMYPVSVEKLSEGSRTFLRARRTNTTLNPSMLSMYSTINALSDIAKNYDKGIVSFKARASHPVKMSTMIHKINTSGSITNGSSRNIDITTNWQTFSFEIPLGSDLDFIRANPMGTFTNISSFINSFYLDLCEWKLEGGTVATGWTEAPEDAKAELAKVVYKTDISVTNEGIIHSASKTVNGQTIASMIAQRAEWVEIIAQLLKVKGDMIVDGAITGVKLDVSDLSAISADLGSVNAGKMLLQRSFSSGSSAVPAYNYPAFKTGLFVDNYGLIVNGNPVQKFTTEATASDMPVVAVTSGEIRFLRANLTDNIEEVLHTGLSDPDFGYIQFGRDSSGKNALIIEANGQIYLKGENYTDWAFSTIDNRVRWKVQGNLVIVDYDVTFPTGGTKHIVTVPTKYVPKALMLTAKAWHTFLDRDRNAQLNADGGLHILGAEANQRYCGQILWSY